MRDLIAKILQLAVDLYARFTREPAPEASEHGSRPMAWGAKVSPVFRDRVRWIEDHLDLPADWLMSIIAFESAYTFSPSIRNAAGSGATGLIQFMPRTARDLGTTTDKLAAMSPEDQLNYVYLYFRPYRGRIKSIEDAYMAVLWPRAIGEPNDYALWTTESHPTAYRQNRGLDINGDGRVTKREAAQKVREALERGRRAENMG